jgi:hypothetical protein
MKLDGVLSGLVGSSGDPGAFLKGELQEAISPVTDRVDALEKKLDLLILAIGRVEDLLKSIQPVVALLKKLPFFK